MDNKKIIDELLTYIIDRMHWCPFEDDVNIDFVKECVGFSEPGCKECVLKHIDLLNLTNRRRNGEKTE